MTDLGLRKVGATVCRIGVVAAAGAAAAAAGAETGGGAVTIPSSAQLERGPMVLQSSGWLAGLNENGGGTGADEAPVCQHDEDAALCIVGCSGDCEDDAERTAVQLGIGDNARGAGAATAEDPLLMAGLLTRQTCALLLAASPAVGTTGMVVLLLSATGACVSSGKLRGVSGVGVAVGSLKSKLLGGAGARRCANSASSSATSPRSKPVRTVTTAASAFPEAGLQGGGGRTMAGSLTDNSMASRPCTLSHSRPGLPSGDRCVANNSLCCVRIESGADRSLGGRDTDCAVVIAVPEAIDALKDDTALFPGKSRAPEAATFCSTSRMRHFKSSSSFLRKDCNSATAANALDPSFPSACISSGIDEDCQALVFASLVVVGGEEGPANTVTSLSSAVPCCISSSMGGSDSGWRRFGECVCCTSQSSAVALVCLP